LPDAQTVRPYVIDRNSDVLQHPHALCNKITKIPPHSQPTLNLSHEYCVAGMAKKKKRYGMQINLEESTIGTISAFAKMSQVTE
jgi:hypothetical protein